jgi:hypothetical protein
MTCFKERLSRGLGYLIIGFGAVWLLMFAPPPAMTHALGFWLTLTWCGMIFTSIPAAYAVFVGDFTREYVLLPFFTGGLWIALAFGYTRLYSSPEIGLRLYLLTGLALVLVARWFEINDLIERPILRGRPPWRWIGIRLPH